MNILIMKNPIIQIIKTFVFNSTLLIQKKKIKFLQIIRIIIISFWIVIFKIKEHNLFLKQTLNLNNKMDNLHFLLWINNKVGLTLIIPMVLKIITTKCIIINKWHNYKICRICKTCKICKICRVCKTCKECKICRMFKICKVCKISNKMFKI